MTPASATASGSPMQPPVVQPPVVPPVVLEGRHIRLEPLTLGHARALVEVANGPRESYGFTLVPADETSMLRYIEAALRDQEAGRALPFATVAKATGRVVGSTRLAASRRRDCGSIPREGSNRVALLHRSSTSDVASRGLSDRPP